MVDGSYAFFLLMMSRKVDKHAEVTSKDKLFNLLETSDVKLGKITKYELLNWNSSVSEGAIENGKYGACFGSGMAAIDCVIKMLNPGDEVISTNDLYGGSYRIFTKIFENYGIKFRKF